MFHCFSGYFNTWRERIFKEHNDLKSWFSQYCKFTCQLNFFEETLSTYILSPIIIILSSDFLVGSVAIKIFSFGALEVPCPINCQFFTNPILLREFSEPTLFFCTANF